MRRLRRENRALREEREILRKAAWFERETCIRGRSIRGAAWRGRNFREGAFMSPTFRSRGIRSRQSGPP